MTNHKMLTRGAVLAMMLITPGVVLAQQHQHRQSPQQGMMMQGSMGNMHMGAMNGNEMMMNMMGMSTNIMRLQPNQVLSQADELGLSQDQTSRIQEIALAQQDAHSAHMNSMAGHNGELDRLLGDGNVSDAEIREWVDESAEPYRDMHGRMILDALAVREILSQEQRESALACRSIHRP